MSSKEWEERSKLVISHKKIVRGSSSKARNIRAYIDHSCDAKSQELVNSGLYTVKIRGTITIPHSGVSLRAKEVRTSQDKWPQLATVPCVQTFVCSSAHQSSICIVNKHMLNLFTLATVRVHIVNWHSVLIDFVTRAINKDGRLIHVVPSAIEPRLTVEVLGCIEGRPIVCGVRVDKVDPDGLAGPTVADEVLRCIIFILDVDVVILIVSLRLFTVCVDRITII